MSISWLFWTTRSAGRRRFSGKAGVPGWLVLGLLLACPARPGGPAQFSLVAEWGEYGTKQGQFKYPCMVAVDGSSTVYVVDQHNHRVQKFNSDGRFLLSWGTFGEGPGQFNYPFGIAVDSRGAVYVSDMNNHRVGKFSPDGQLLRTAGGYGAGHGQFKHPYGLAIDERDLLYVIDSLNYRVQKLDQDLGFVAAWGSEASIGVKIYMPHEIAIGREGSVILSDRQNHRISVFRPDGKLVKRFGGYGEGPEAPGGRFSEPHGVAVGPDGSIYVCDRYNFRVLYSGPQNSDQPIS